MTTIAFICVGNMGGPMARNLAKAGHDVRAFDLSAALLDERFRAVTIDKDNASNWQPADPAGVSDADIANYFAPLPQAELSL